MQFARSRTSIEDGVWKARVALEQRSGLVYS